MLQTQWTLMKINNKKNKSNHYQPVALGRVWATINPMKRCTLRREMNRRSRSHLRETSQTSRGLLYPDLTTRWAAWVNSWLRYRIHRGLRREMKVLKIHQGGRKAHKLHLAVRGEGSCQGRALRICLNNQTKKSQLRHVLSRNRSKWSMNKAQINRETTVLNQTQCPNHSHNQISQVHQLARTKTVWSLSRIQPRTEVHHHKEWPMKRPVSSRL